MSQRYAFSFAGVGITGVVFGAMVGVGGIPFEWFGGVMLAIGANYAFQTIAPCFTRIAVPLEWCAN